jgi:hypothetical protein
MSIFPVARVDGIDAAGSRPRTGQGHMVVKRGVNDTEIR